MPGAHFPFEVTDRKFIFLHIAIKMYILKTHLTPAAISCLLLDSAPQPVLHTPRLGSWAAPGSVGGWTQSVPD